MICTACCLAMRRMAHKQNTPDRDVSGVFHDKYQSSKQSKNCRTAFTDFHAQTHRTYSP